MPTGRPIDPAVKAVVLTKIRDEGMSVTEVCNAYSITSKSVYRWLREGVVDGDRNLILENNRLKKELEIAYRILGKLTADTQRSKE